MSVTFPLEKEERNTSVTFPFAEKKNDVRTLFSEMPYIDSTSTVIGVLNSTSSSLLSSNTLKKASFNSQKGYLDVIQSTKVISLLNLSSWQLNTIRAIAELANLPNDWDGYGSLKIQPKALANAFRLVLAIQIEELLTPHISPVPGGGIQLEWQISTRELELEILPDGSIEYLTVLGEDDMEEGCLSLDQFGEAQKLIDWLMNK